MKFLVTGVAGFIGSHISKRLLDDGNQVVGIDNMNDCYDLQLKRARLNSIKGSNFRFYKLDISNRKGITKLFCDEKFNRVIHLAARAGVRYSLKYPYSCANTNLTGHLNILEACRHNNIQHMIYASSSSVYGLNHKKSFSISDSIDYPISLYAATKRANELMSHTYSYVYGLPTTGLRFFTVYGPWSRPDMAIFKFTKAILKGESIKVYNFGNMKRDFTYIDDISEAIMRLQNIIPKDIRNKTVKKNFKHTNFSAPYRIYNVGNNKSVKLMDYISALEESLGVKAKKKMVSIQLGDMLETNADTKELYEAIGFKPETLIKDGVRHFVEWYKNFYLFK